MIIAGAGGHSLEIKAELITLGFDALDLLVYDDEIGRSDFDENLLLKFKLEASIVSLFDKDSRFVLGVGNPFFREKLYQKLTSLGGKLFSIKAISARVETKDELQYDALSFSFVGSNVKIGKGTLINVRAGVHHESEIGEFCEISPGAILLGGVKIGDKCRIGAGAVLLPGVTLGEKVVVGAGAVVTKDFSSGSKVKGIPASPVSI
ncbi:DapH/DapD/GlmU-related protein [Algoriphagus aquimarinus]|uniref:Sugar O-acyltransferase, sialic acid O-acetyltransferase NeuD family n=1 Tax=Algoriphagus aquimarinus TaxID=237018 RepID=A0A1I1A021_9BACT|nr:DapH/DapD/GlmU-related protein [Algoriphagus aquimarinus]SFB30922.1 sugar O-acyltransferase, sialic acid O-acetyltransferase NeuD family [Algoriphagus aquimarinus]